MLQYVEGIYAHSGTFNVSKSTPAGTFTESIAVEHQGRAATVHESVVFAANSGSSQTSSQSFTITDKSTPGSPDFVVDVTNANFVFELSLAHPYVINDPPLTVSYYVEPLPNGGFGSTSASPWYACGETWSLFSNSPPLQASWSGPYSYWDLCIDYNFFIGGTMTLSDTGGYYYSTSSVSYTGSYDSGHYDVGTTATASMGWSYVEIVGYP